MSLMAPSTTRRVDPQAKYKISNNTDGVIRLPTQPALGETKGEKRVRSENYITLGTRHERGYIGAPQPDVEVSGEVWAYMQTKKAVQEMISPTPRMVNGVMRAPQPVISVVKVG